MGERRDHLIEIVGADNFTDDPETLEIYSRDQSLVPPQKPRFVVKPKNAAEVQAIAKWANQTATPLVPISSGLPHFRGDTVPSLPEAVIVDLSRMNQIIRIDRRNRVVIVEPGVTFAQLQPELAKEGLRLTMPLLPRSNKSVVASLLEREPTLVPKYNWAIPEPLRCLEVVFGSGDILRTGEAGDHGPLEKQWQMGFVQTTSVGPRQVDYHRVVTAAQGSMGIVTWASISCEILPQIHKFSFVPAEKLDSLIDFAYRLLRFRYADELLFLNNVALATILEKTVDGMSTLKEELPQWVLILGLAGRDLLPRERVEFQEKDIADLAQQFGVQFVSKIPGVRDAEVVESLLNACEDPYWKLRRRGGCEDIFFVTTLNRTPEFINTMHTLSQRVGYPTSEIGVYVQPVHQGVACHCEFSLPYDPSKHGEVTRIQRLLAEGSKALMDQGAFFSRPYGIWADMVYNRDAQTMFTLRKIKGIFDPNNVMNPGKLCF